MFDNLRDDASASPFYQEEEEEALPDFLAEEEQPQKKSASETFAWLGPILSMTPMQRLILSSMLFMMVCVVGTMFLLVTGTFALF